jgi:HNH endonuclease/NUMOD4 motif
MDEEWKQIEGFPNYEVSSEGRIRGGRWGNILKGTVDNDGYHRHNLYADKDTPCLLGLHRIVASAFIPNPDNKLHIDHINRDKSDNRVCNLRWATPQENELNKPCGRSNTRYITIQKNKKGEDKYYRVTIGERQLFKTLEEAIAYRDAL